MKLEELGAVIHSVAECGIDHVIVEQSEIDMLADSSATGLDELRKQGAIGERFDGLAVARDASAKKVVKDVNANRSAIYKRESQKTGANVTAVGKIYAKQIMKKAPTGTWFLNEKNKWVRK